MASSKRTKAAPTDGELDSLFEGLGGDTAVPKKPTTKSSKATAATTANEDILAELESQIGSSSQPAPSSRPHTPRIKDTATTAKGSPSVTAAAAARRSAESARSSSHPALTPSATSSAADAEGDKKDVGGTSADAGPSQQPAAPAQGTTSKSGGSSWWGWGGIVAQATAAASVAMKTAEAAVKEIQQNDEAKKWAEQVRGNVGALKGIGK